MPDVREHDEVTVWRWHRDGDSDPNWWEVVLPLLAADERRIGSLIIWEKGEAAISLSHIHVISSHLRIELQKRIQLIGWTPADPAVADGVRFSL
ncbi:MAG: hypothetical protein Q7S20_06120 [Gemmatimonadaceae bacterium]|nr:hypothetical protein [Gemmatimonadaceae bacterium]